MKNERQIEFSELMDKLRRLGLKPARVAEALDVSDAAISQILNGHTSPSAGTLGSMRWLVERTEKGLEKRDAADLLNELREHAPHYYTAASETIAALHRQIRGPTANLKTAGEVIQKVVADVGGKPSSRRPGRAKKSAMPPSNVPSEQPKP